MGVFKRYTEEAKRAIYFARTEALLREATAISPAHLLLGLSWGEDSLANEIAALKDRLPELCARMGTPFRPCSIARFDSELQIPLDSGLKIALAYATKEADREWWDEQIDTDHLLRGLLSFNNVASDALIAVGVELDAVRSAAYKIRRGPSGNFLSVRRIFGYGWRVLRPPLLALGFLAAAGLLIVLIVRLVNR
jgi:ATP-dependent Clp protease ATP-binding subunit ClpA